MTRSVGEVVFPDRSLSGNQWLVATRTHTAACEATPYFGNVQELVFLEAEAQVKGDFRDIDHFLVALLRSWPDSFSDYCPGRDMHCHVLSHFCLDALVS